jgi:hypothetical protein
MVPLTLSQRKRERGAEEEGGPGRDGSRLRSSDKIAKRDVRRLQSGSNSMARSIGASYLIRQIAGSERIGGLRVTLRPPSRGRGTITVEYTDWHTGQPLEYRKDIEPLAQEAIRGIYEVAERFKVSLEEFDVVLSHFVDHPVDSFPPCYYQAGKSAFRSALEAWEIRDLTPG